MPNATFHIDRFTYVDASFADAINIFVPFKHAIAVRFFPPIDHYYGTHIYEQSQE